MSLGDNIRYLRIQHNYSQDYVAEKLGYKSYTTIQKWESGVSEPPVKILKELALLFNVDMDDLANKDYSNTSVTSAKNQEADQPIYYLDKEASAAAQFLYENPDYKVLFDATRKVKKEDIDFVKEMLDRLSNKN